MPIYDYKCSDCDLEQERYEKIDALEVRCSCGGVMRRKITTRYAVHGDVKPYIDENIAKNPVLVKNRRHREQLMKENGLSESYGRGWY